MSYDLPPGPPPSDPPSGPPPSGLVETLDSHGGDRRPARRARRTTVLALAGAVGVVAIGGAAWAAYSFLSTGAQPAEALPDSTIAYASIDLDPSGGQKIAALRTLKKFPAFEDAVGLDTDDDVRRWIFEQVQDDAGCADLDYDDDVEPWLGDRFAVAAVDTGADTPAPVVVIQVSDADKADTGLDRIRDCAGGDADDGAWSINGDWLLLGEDQQTVDDIADDAADGSLADDDDFRHWTDEAGGSGILSLYAAPGAGPVLADQVERFGDDLAPLATPPGDDLVPPETLDLLKEFKGAAATLRFDDGGLELEMAADAGASGQVAGGGDSAGDAMASLPADTAAALALSFGDDWTGDVLDRVADATGESTADLVSEASSALGIDLPGDAETLAGDAIAIAVDGDVDLEGLMTSPEPGSAGPTGVGVKILGDADGIEGVLEKLRTAAAGEDGGILDSDQGDGAVAVGPDADYRATLLSDQGLGDSDAFEHVVEHSDGASAILYVDFDAGDDWLAELADDEPDVKENLEPLAALGLSTWLDGDTTHAVLEVTSD